MKRNYSISDFDFLLSEDNFIVTYVINDYTDLHIRIMKINGNSLFGTANFDERRLNVEIKNNKVVKFIDFG